MIQSQYGDIQTSERRCRKDAVMLLNADGQHISHEWPKKSMSETIGDICQLAQLVGTNHVSLMHSYTEYWRTFSHQERNANKLFTATIDLVRQVEKGSLSIIDFGIELEHLQSMYYQSSGLFYFPLLKTSQLHSLHGCALGVPKLFTNKYGCPPDWVAALQEGNKAGKVTTLKLANRDRSDLPAEQDVKVDRSDQAVSGNQDRSILLIRARKDNKCTNDESKVNDGTTADGGSTLGDGA
jgi:hypothetical protein